MRKKVNYFLFGSLIGIVFVVFVAGGGYFAYRYFRQGEGLGKIKAVAKRILKDGDGATSYSGSPAAVIKQILVKVKQKIRPRKLKPLVYGLPVPEKEFSIFAVSSLDRVFQDGKTLLKPHYGSSAAISAAKNEYESFQVVVSNGPDIQKAVRIEISEFICDMTGKLLGRENILWRVVGYVKTQMPYYPVKYVGMWPDPLLPAKSVDIEPNTVQPFWVTAYVPKDAQAGIYKGSIKVFSKDRLLGNIPVSIEVRNFILPTEGNLKTAFDFYGQETGSQYPKKERETQDEYDQRIAELNEKYIFDMLKHRINPILNIDPLSQRELGRVDWYRMYGLNNFSIGRYGGSLGNNWPESDDEVEALLPLYRTYGENLKINKMFEFHYIYTWDEGEIGDPRVPKVCSMIHRAYPGLKNMVCYHGIWEPAKFPDWGKDINIWCVQIDDYDEGKANTLKKLGMEIWMYVSGPGSTGSPNLALDFDSIDYRIIPWLCWKYDIRGFLYWCVNWWPLVDPFKSAKNTKWEQNGNGLLYYPGEDGPIDSLRLEVLRDGMEDYEYLHLLREKLKEFEKAGLAAVHYQLAGAAVKLLDVDSSIIASPMSFAKDEEFIAIRRGKIAKAIEWLSEILEKNQQPL
ncbi:MAG: DUF4091 domain-containing protein [Candidatus Omnitrophica bacterium]|nr:DUF4091 domain-containing protein [Candidatus Omnitrophota bacterium]